MNNAPTLNEKSKKLLELKKKKSADPLNTQD